MDTQENNWNTALVVAAVTAASPLLLSAVMPPAFAMLLGPIAVAIPFFAMAALESAVDAPA